MDLNLKNTLALVTGSTSGIGKAVAAGLLREGASVIINGRSKEHVATVVLELRALGNVHGVAADLATAIGTEQLIAQVSAIGPVDILVNNVGFFEFKPFFEVTDEEWSKLFGLNVMSGVRLARTLLKDMLERDWGRIVFVSSEAGVKPNPEMIHYSVTKTAQIALARGLAELTKGTRVTVNSALVAPTWTEGVETFLSKIAASQGTSVEALKIEYFKADGFNSLLQRFATVDEIAALIVFLCSRNASAINGAAERVDGGMVRSIL